MGRLQMNSKTERCTGQSSKTQDAQPSLLCHALGNPGEHEPSKSGGLTELNVLPHPWQRSGVRFNVPALRSLQYPVPSWNSPGTPPSYLISIKWCDQKVLPRTTSDIPVTQETPRIVALSKEQDKDQIHVRVIRYVNVTLVFFSFFP